MMKIRLISFYMLLISFLALSSCSGEENACTGPGNIELGADIILQEGSQLTLSAYSKDAAYLWSTGETTASITIDTTGIFWVKVTACDESVSDTIVVRLSYATVKVATNHGEFRIWLYPETPLHRENFLALAGDGFYNGLIFHRVIENFVIQGGDPEGTGFGGPGYTISAEIKTNLKHDSGAVGAARLGDEVNPDKESNGSQFYIVCDPNGEPGLNGKYTVFGQVFWGMSVVMSISQVEVDENDRPETDVVMEQVTIEFYTAEELLGLFGFEISD